MYETVCTLLQFGWLIAIFATHLIIHFFLRLRFKKTLTFLSGYIIGLVCVYTYWWYAAEYAPTEKIKSYGSKFIYIDMKDQYIFCERTASIYLLIGTVLFLKWIALVSSLRIKLGTF